MSSIWEHFVRAHGSIDWSSLVLFYGIVAATVCWVLLQMARASRQEKRIAEVEAKLTQKVHERTATISDTVDGIESRSRQMQQQADAFRRRVDEVEDRIPNLYDRMEEFRNTLATIFQNELGAVLGSFDTSVSAVLAHMKSDLHMGIARIEDIEQMVKSRDEASRNLLSGNEKPALAEATEDVQDTETPPDETSILLGEQPTQAEGAEETAAVADEMDVWMMEEDAKPAEETTTGDAVEETTAEADDEEKTDYDTYRSEAA